VFNVNGTEHKADCPRLMIPVPVRQKLPRDWRKNWTEESFDHRILHYKALILKPVGVFIDGVYFSRANV
jgi:hypothetical protein